MHSQESLPVKKILLTSVTEYFHTDMYNISIFQFMLFMVALWNRADHYSSSCGFFFFFSSPNLSHRRLDVCHTSTHGVALV